MKRYFVQELFGSLFSDDLQFTAENLNDVKKQYLKERNIKGTIVYDSILNSVQDNSRCICIQQGWYEGNVKHIRGKRYFYKVVTQ